MHSRLFLSLVAAAGLLVAGSSANAGALTAATWTQTIQGVDLTLTNAGATCTSVGANLVQQTITCPGAGLGATGSASASDYSVSLTVPLFAISQFTTGGAINVNTVATLSGSQLVNGVNSSATATQGVAGGATVRVAVHTKGSLLVAGMTTLVKVPLSVGMAATATGYFYVTTTIHYVTLDFYAWTPHTLTFSGLTSKNAPLPGPTVQAMGSFALTGMGGGTVTLVSPSLVSIDGPLAQRRSLSVTTLQLSYAPSAPEPGTLLLLGSAAAGLLLLGGRGRR